MIAHEVMHHVKKHKGKKVFMVLKVDMKKAYDRIEWIFLIWVLKAWGFSEHFLKLIYSCINTVNFSILLNGNVTRTIKPSRGLRQGDHLSHFLFIMCDEVFMLLMDIE